MLISSAIVLVAHASSEHDERRVAGGAILRRQLALNRGVHLSQRYWRLEFVQVLGSA